jgi:phosphoribosylaminoimidazolecarboxamide formyltransferase/IMP cyclohydrolase
MSSANERPASRRGGSGGRRIAPPAEHRVSSASPSSERRALLSVSDRSGVVDLARALVRHGFTILSTGGTAAHLVSAGVPVRSVSEETGFPEVFGGRIKTLHPRLFGGILFDRSVPADVAQAAEQDIAPIELVAVNLYPFEQGYEDGRRRGLLSDPAWRALQLAKIDVGGPSLLRAAAKNHAHVTVLCDPADYPAIIVELESGGVSEATRRTLAAKVFRRTAAYDAVIARWLGEASGSEAFPERLTPTYTRATLLRYGENPHQAGAFYADPQAPPSALARFLSLQGKELSYNNLLDADAALFTSRVVGPGTLTIVKHRIPSGIARSSSPAAAFENAWASDPVAGFGGVVAYTGVLDEAAAERMTSRFLEVVVAEGVGETARARLASKPNLRVLTVAPAASRAAEVQVRGVDGGLLVQEGDLLEEDESAWRVATERAPSQSERRALSFAWRAVRGVVSNAIVVAGAEATYGIGGGRTSRVDACRDAVAKAGERARGAVAASDAFFPFPDGLEVLAEAGVAAVVQPGGSVRDADVIAAANARGMAMLFTAHRHFRH